MLCGHCCHKAIILRLPRTKAYLGVSVISALLAQKDTVWVSFRVRLSLLTIHVTLVDKTSTLFSALRIGSPIQFLSYHDF